MKSLEQVIEELAQEVRALRKQLERPALMSYSEAAGHLGIHRQLVGQLAAEGCIRTVKVGSIRRVPASEIDRAQREGLEKRRRQPVRLPPTNSGDVIRSLKPE